MCSWAHAAGMSLGAISSESLFQNAFWNTLIILDKSSIGISETHTPHLSVQCHLTFSLVLSPEEKKKSAHKRVNVFERSVIPDEMQT